MLAGRRIELGFSGRRTDRYGRLLAQVFAHDVVGGGPALWVQGWMLTQGLARAYGLDGSSACLAELISHEQVARLAAVGLWAQPAYAVRDAEQVDDLLARRGTFQIVEGRVRVVADARNVTFMNFGADVRADFTISIRAPARRLMAAAGVDPQQWAGRRVRVRGWIERRGGPLIEIHHAGEIEAVDGVTQRVEPAAPAAAVAGRRARGRGTASAGAAPN